MTKRIGYVVDSNKYIGSAEQKYRKGNPAFIGYPKGKQDLFNPKYEKKYLDSYRPQGSFVSKTDIKRLKSFNKECLIEVAIDGKDLVQKNGRLFPCHNKKFNIVEKNYRPNNLNRKNYIITEDKTAQKSVKRRKI